MRIKALILFFPFAVFLFETASFIPAMQEACTLAATEVQAEQSSCCMKQEKEEPVTGQCQAQTEDNNQTPVNDCTDNPDCTTCPVCYTFIFQSQYEWPATQFLFKKNYGLLTASYIYSYTPDVWKPPNGFPVLHS